MRISFCILTSGHSHELKIVGGKELVILYPAKSYTSSNFLSQGCKILPQSQTKFERPLAQTPRKNCIIYASYSQERKIHDQRLAKRPFLKGLILQTLLHPSLVYLCNKSVCWLSPLIQLYCRPDLHLEIFRVATRRRILLFLGCQSQSTSHLQRTLGLQCFVAHWFSRSLTNHLSFLQVNNPFKPLFLFREHLEAKFISHHQLWHFCFHWKTAEIWARSW